MFEAYSWAGVLRFWQVVRKLIRCTEVDGRRHVDRNIVKFTLEVYTTTRVQLLVCLLCVDLLCVHAQAHARHRTKTKKQKTKTKKRPDGVRAVLHWLFNRSIDCDWCEHVLVCETLSSTVKQLKLIDIATCTWHYCCYELIHAVGKSYSVGDVLLKPQRFRQHPTKHAAPASTLLPLGSSCQRTPPPPRPRVPLPSSFFYDSPLRFCDNGLVSGLRLAASLYHAPLFRLVFGKWTGASKPASKEEFLNQMNKVRGA